MNKRRSFIVGISSTKLLPSERTFIKRYKPWVVILFTRNIKSINQTKILTSSIRKIFNDDKYPILIDQEGGKVNRLKNFISFDNLTSEFFGKKFINNKREFIIYYKLFIDKTSFLLKAMGININTSPVLDLRIKGTSNIIGDRSFSNNPKVVSQIGDHCIKYFQQNGIGTVIKHIPGHGLANLDSHKSLPIVNKSLNYLLNNDFKCFKNNNSHFAMTAHVLFNHIDKTNCATHSKKIINNIIRKKLGYKGIIISDDINMKALKYEIVESAIKAIDAGCNLALYCKGNYRDSLKLLKKIPPIDAFTSKKTSEFYKFLG